MTDCDMGGMETLGILRVIDVFTQSDCKEDHLAFTDSIVQNLSYTCTSPAEIKGRHLMAVVLDKYP